MTTGSLVAGTVEGLPGELSSRAGKVINLIDGTPDGVIETAFVSGVAFDESGTGQFYMGKTGTLWIKLGSVA